MARITCKSCGGPRSRYPGSYCRPCYEGPRPRESDFGIDAPISGWQHLSDGSLARVKGEAAPERVIA